MASKRDVLKERSPTFVACNGRSVHEQFISSACGRPLLSIVHTRDVTEVVISESNSEAKFKFGLSEPKPESEAEAEEGCVKDRKHGGMKGPRATSINMFVLIAAAVATVHRPPI